jgi:hypothetical protein
MTMTPPAARSTSCAASPIILLVAANRDVLHKIGVTGGDVRRRIANAKLDPTFLMAEVKSSRPTPFTTSTAPSSKT